MKNIFNYSEYKTLYESEVLNEASMFDKYSRIIGKTNKDFVKIEPILIEYERTKKDAVTKRVNNKKAMVDVDDAKKEDLNNQLIKINGDEKKKLALIEKKLGDFVKDKNKIISFYIQSRLNETKNNMIKLELKQSLLFIDKTAQDRFKAMIKNNDDALKLRAKELDAMMKDENVDTKQSSKKIGDLEKKSKDKETDYNADGKIEPEEKVVRDQADQADKKSPLKDLAKKAGDQLTKKYTPS